MCAAGADKFLVTTGSGLALVDAFAPGVSILVKQTQDGGHYGNVRFKQVEAIPIADGDIQCAISEATLALAGYLVGVAQKAFQTTIDYMQIRRQFGHVIGSFQVLQHRAVDLYLELSLMRASMESAAALYDYEAPPLQQV